MTAVGEGRVLLTQGTFILVSVFAWEIYRQGRMPIIAISIPLCVAWFRYGTLNDTAALRNCSACFS